MDAIEGRGDAPFRREDVRAPFEQLGRQPGGDRVRLAGQLRADGGDRAGIATEQDLERADRLLAGELDLPKVVA